VQRPGEQNQRRRQWHAGDGQLAGTFAARFARRERVLRARRQPGGEGSSPGRSLPGLRGASAYCVRAASQTVSASAIPPSANATNTIALPPNPSSAPTESIAIQGRLVLPVVRSSPGWYRSRSPAAACFAYWK